MDSALDLTYCDDLPADLALDPSHPASDPYLKGIQKIKRLIIGQTLQMSNMHVEVVKQTHRGVATNQIAENVDITPVTVRNILKRPHARRLRALLIHLDQALDGPSEAQRRAMLGRIMNRNEIEDPRVAISAIDTVNKMDHLAQQIAAQHTGNQPINITINADLLPRTVLDG